MIHINIWIRNSGQRKSNENWLPALPPPGSIYNMNKMGVPTESTFLDVQLPKTLLESPSTSTFLPDEEAAFCPLLSSRMLGPIAHPLSPNHMDTDGITSNCQISLDCKAESSSTDSSSGIAIDVQESATTNLFHNGSYQHLQNNNINKEELCAR
ncbi:uncharacterized protein LOC113565768 isoform X3 [Drosophila persimilis]|uniref:uncharacterized protein LOC113565768 isoform X3 n=1 Tax=Drosophila persimilis TaxID=7234 RepID=UPI000F07E0B0|nr:uncharacterized protein LOC113565768 isoform X3 [Drosophila persimilis]